jgi:solute carrier family 25 citrate transporter 1
VLRDRNGKLSDGGRLAAGFAAGITEALLIVTPFEVVKIRLQQQKGLAYDKLKYHVSAAAGADSDAITTTACCSV